MPPFTKMNQMHPLTILCGELDIQDLKGINNKYGKGGGGEGTRVNLHLQNILSSWPILIYFFPTAL